LLHGGLQCCLLRLQRQRGHKGGLVLVHIGGMAQAICCECGRRLPLPLPGWGGGSLHACRLFSRSMHAGLLTPHVLPLVLLLLLLR